MQRFFRSADLSLTVLAAGVGLLTPGAVQASAPTAYQIQAIAHVGDKIGDATTRPGGGFYIGGLNDRGQLVFGVDSAKGEMLAEYTGGQLKPIAIPGQPSPNGTWPTGAQILDPASINQRGDIVFATAKANSASGLGTYLWDDQKQQITVVAVKGMPAVNNLTFQDGGGPFPTITNQDEIAFPASVKNAAGALRWGVFLRSPDGQLQTVALPDQTMPGGVTLGAASRSVINDSGTVAFNGAIGVPTAYVANAYLWANGTLTRILQANTAAPGGGTFANAFFEYVNNQNQNVLIEAGLKGLNTSFGALYLWENGQLRAVAIPGQDMPGGGKLKGAYGNGGDVSFANGLGQYTFIGVLDDGSTGAYRIDADGSLSLILKSGTTTALGVITDVGESGQGGAAINSQGQVGLALGIKGQPRTLALLTPVSP